MEAGCKDSLPERMLEGPEKTLAGVQEEMTELYGQSQADRVTEELPSLSSPLFFVQEYEALSRGIPGKNIVSNCFA